MKKMVLGLAACMLVFNACKESTETKQDAGAKKEDAKLAQDERNRVEVEKLNNEYPRIPDDKLLDGGPNLPVYSELKERYKQNLVKLKSSVEATGAKFVMVIITPEVGKNPSNQNKFGLPFIHNICKELGVELYDLSPSVATQDPLVITQAPKDGHWSKKGAEFVADFIQPVLKKYASHKSTTTYKDSDRPETFADLAPNDDEILDGGKDLPYHVKANSKGLRMDQEVTFPKTKQHILVMGGSQLFSPFLDNEFITTSVLQKRFPETVVMNAAAISSSLDDYISLFEEKAKYTEPDVVIVQTNGGDITDLFFSNRNHLGRSHAPHKPTEIEEKYYKEVMDK